MRVVEKSGMLKAMSISVALSLLALPRMAWADFVLFLKNGNEIKTEQYDEIGDEIHYRRFGGQIRLRKSDVVAILNSETFDVRIFHTGFSLEELETIRRLAEQGRKFKEAEEAADQAEKAARDEESLRRYEAILKEKAEKREQEQREAATRITGCLATEHRHLSRLKTMEQRIAYCEGLIELERDGILREKLPW